MAKFLYSKTYIFNQNEKYRERFRDTKEKRLNISIDIQSFTDIKCDPGGTQTHDLQNRNLSFYSLNYRAYFGCKVT